MNPHRGEVELELGGEKRILRPTFEVIGEIEAGTGFGLLDMARRLRDGSWTVGQIATIIRAGLKGSEGKARTVNEIGQWVFEATPLQCAASAMELILNALSGGRDADANPPTPTE